MTAMPNDPKPPLPPPRTRGTSDPLRPGLRITKQQSDALKQKMGDEIIQPCPSHIRAFFIGGAGDAIEFKAFAFSPRIGPRTGIMSHVKSEADVKLREIVAGHDYQSYYLGYEDVHPEDREKGLRPEDQIRAVVESRIPTEDTAVYIIGHSLGATNGLHVALHLLRTRFNVVMVVTLDPVAGVNLYRVYPAMEPAHSQFEWINVAAMPDRRDESDFIAFAGRPWDLSGSSAVDVHIPRDLHHGEASRMFFEGAPSPFQRMAQSIAEYIRTNCRK